MTLRQFILLIALLAGIVLGVLEIRHGRSDVSSPQQPEKPVAVTIVKQPPTITQRTFDPAAPPPDMPPLGRGEVAVCDSNFVSSANVAGESRRKDPAHATLTVTHVTVALQLNITIWIPTGATQRVIDHEDGHRQISEYFYQSAGKVADQIAQTYIGKTAEITGGDLNDGSRETLGQMAAEITDQYDKQLNPNPTQLLYDTITDHSRNDIDAKGAVESAINSAAIAAIQPAAAPAN